MDNMDKLTLDEKIELMKEDYENEWWRPSKIDDFELKNKLLRIGCRPIKRKYLKCKLNMQEAEDFKNCKQIEKQLNECYESLYIVYLSSKQEESKKL